MTQHHEVIVALASNNQAESHLDSARQRLREWLCDTVCTEAIWTAPVGAHADSSRPYLNQLLKATTTLTVDELNARFKLAEKELGRTPEMRQQGLVPIDIDLLSYDQQRHHCDDWQRPYVGLLLPKLKAL